MDKDPKTGHFLPGNKMASGLSHPNQKYNLKLRDVVLECVTPEVLKESFLRLIQLTKSKDEKLAAHCCEVLQNRALGKPKESLDVTTNGGSPGIDYARLSPTELDTLTGLLAKAAEPRVIESEAVPITSVDKVP